jgi:hypothetical protein
MTLIMGIEPIPEVRLESAAVGSPSSAASMAAHLKFHRNMSKNWNRNVLHTVPGASSFSSIFAYFIFCIFYYTKQTRDYCMLLHTVCLQAAK